MTPNPLPCALAFSQPACVTCTPSLSLFLGCFRRWVTWQLPVKTCKCGTHCPDRTWFPGVVSNSTLVGDASFPDIIPDMVTEIVNVFLESLDTLS